MIIQGYFLSVLHKNICCGYPLESSRRGDFKEYPQHIGERSGSVVECRTPEREVRGSRPTAAVLCPWARHFTPRKYWLITQEAMAPSRHDWKIVDWDVKPQHNQTHNICFYGEISTGRLMKISWKFKIKDRTQSCHINCYFQGSFVWRFRKYLEQF